MFQLMLCRSKSLLLALAKMLTFTIFHYNLLCGILLEDTKEILRKFCGNLRHLLCISGSRVTFAVRMTQ